MVKRKTAKKSGAVIWVLAGVVGIGAIVLASRWISNANGFLGTVNNPYNYAIGWQGTGYYNNVPNFINNNLGNPSVLITSPALFTLEGT